MICDSNYLFNGRWKSIICALSQWGKLERSRWNCENLILKAQETHFWPVLKAQIIKKNLKRLFMYPAREIW